MSCSATRPPKDIVHRHDPRHCSGRSATSRKAACLCSCVGLMWRLESRASPATHTWAPVSVTATVRCLVPLSSATVTSTVGWEDTCVPTVVTEPETALAGVVLLERLEPLQHFLKWPRFRHPRQTASLAGQEALSGVCVVLQFQQVREGCVLAAVAAATSGGQSSSSTTCTVPATQLCSRHELPPTACWRAASGHQHCL